MSAYSPETRNENFSIKKLRFFAPNRGFHLELFVGKLLPIACPKYKMTKNVNHNDEG